MKDASIASGDEMRVLATPMADGKQHTDYDQLILGTQQLLRPEGTKTASLLYLHLKRHDTLVLSIIIYYPQSTLATALTGYYTGFFESLHLLFHTAKRKTCA